MQSFLVNAFALAAFADAMPSVHKHGHSHVRREAVDVSGVDWSKLDWAAIFGNQKAATTAPTTTVATTQAGVQAATVATSAAASASTSTSSVTATSGKRGIAWDQSNDISLASLFETGANYWVYNWGSKASFDSSMPYLPMIKTPANLDELSSLPAGSTVLGFNEPEMQGLSASDAAGYYKNQMTPLRNSGAIGKLVSPAITNGASGLPWLQAFMAACSDCAIDSLAVHWYGPTMAVLESQMAAIHAAFPSMKLKVTEVGCTNWSEATNPSAAEVSQFMTDAIAWFESTEYIESYAFFAAMPITDVNLGIANSMLTGATAGSSLTDLGKKYVS